MTTVAVVGGGIAGLAAAWELRDRAEVTVFEPDRLGGKLLTEVFEGRPVDCGPDAFLTRVPDAVELCSDLGIGDLVAPAAGRALVWWDGRSRPIPEGVMLGAPSRLRPLLESGILSVTGVVRAGADLFLPRRLGPGDVSVRRLLADRFGGQVADRLADTLVGSIHAGRSEELSAEATVPQLYATARKSRSLLLGLRRGPRPAAGPVFLAPRAGMGELADRLVGGLRDAGVKFESVPVEDVAPAGAGSVSVGGSRFDGCVLAVGAADAARMLGPEAPAALTSIPNASVAMVTMGLPSLPLPPGASGLLVPRSSGWLTTACSFSSQKWPHWAAEGRTVLRVSAGRHRDTRIDEMDDGTLVGRMAGELGTALGVPVEPQSWRVNRWPRSFPQYLVGHPERVRAAEDHLRRVMPGVALAGSSYRGVGIPACIASGRAAARTVGPAGR